MARIEWNCQCNRYEVETKVRELAGEILNDWDAVVAFVFDPALPPTNNDAERALRHAVIARRISFGTRTDKAAASTPPRSASSTPAASAASRHGPTRPASSPPPAQAYQRKLSPPEPSPERRIAPSVSGAPLPIGLTNDSASAEPRPSAPLPRIGDLILTLQQPSQPRSDAAIAARAYPT